MDLGCGNAPIPLILSTKTSANIIGVEIQKDSYELARKSIIYNHLEDRTELLNTYKLRLSVMEEFAPKMLSAEEVKSIMNEKFADVIATKNKGQIMKTVMPEFKGKADGKVVQQVVAELIG